MTTDASLWGLITQASVVVKIVMLLLALASIASWTIIFQRSMFLACAREDIKNFEKKFWSGSDLHQLYASIDTRHRELTGLEHIFVVGFEEFNRLNKQAVTPEAVMEGAGRAMRIALSQEIEKLEQHLSTLATIGSTSPYVGLFGTVWGIMTAFRALGAVQQATIAMVAPGISEALITTAMGLFAAIPAVISYNRYANTVERLVNYYETFQDEFSRILHRQAYGRHQ
jgi:biopolymer transport protein TolQ